MTPTATTRLILATCIMGIFVTASGLLFFWLILHVHTVTQKLGEVETQLAMRETERKNARKAELKLEEVRAAITRIDNVLVNHDRPIEFLEALTRMGKSTGNKIALDYSEQESSPSSLVFRITLDGSKNSTLTYIRVLELTPYVLSVENINWQRITDGSAAGSVTAGTADTRLLFTLRVKTAM